MPALTYFAAHLKCPHCGTISPDDTTTGMQNKLLDTFGDNVLRVGDHPENLTLGDFESAFLTIRLPQAGEPIHLLHEWDCTACGLKSWAELIFKDGTIQSIEDVGLTRASLARAHFISEDVYEDYERLVDSSMWENNEVRPDFAERLSKHLPAQ